MQRKYLIFLLIIFLLGAAARVIYFRCNSYNIDMGDDEPWSKINIALEWARDNDTTIFCFGPLHTYLISCLWFFDGANVVILSRILTLLFGILFMPVYFCVLREFFDEKIAFWGLFLLAIYPLHIHLSSTSLAAVPALFLFFSSLYFLKRFIGNKRTVYLFISAAALNLACMLRFEYWIFIALLPLMLCFEFKFSRDFFLYLALTSIFALFWCSVNYQKTGDPFFFIKTSAIQIQFTMQGIPLRERAIGFICALGTTLSLPIFILCIVGYPLSLRKLSENGPFLFMFTFVLFSYTLKSIHGSFLYEILRYSLLPGALFIPFGAAFLNAIARKKRIRASIKTGTFLVIVCLCLFYSAKTSKAFCEFSVPGESTLDMVTWLKSNILPDDKVILESGRSHPFTVLNAHLSFRQVVRYDSFAAQKDIAALERYFFVSDYVVVFKQLGLFREAVLLPSVRDAITNVYENEDWQIFKVKHNA